MDNPLADLAVESGARLTVAVTCVGKADKTGVAASLSSSSKIVYVQNFRGERNFKA